MGQAERSSRKKGRWNEGKGILLLLLFNNKMFPVLEERAKRVRVLKREIIYEVSS